MEFTVEVSGTKTVDVYTSDVQDALLEAAEQSVQDALSTLDDYNVEDADIDTDTIEVRVKFSGSTTVQVDEDDIRTLVEDQVKDALGDVDDMSIDSIEEA